MGWKRKNWRGKALERECRESFKYYADKGELFWCRLFDTEDFIKVNPNIQIPKQPGDFMMVYNGVGVLIEVKSTITPCFRMEWLRENQSEGLRDVSKLGGGRGYIILSFRGVNASTWAIPFDRVDLKWKTIPVAKAGEIGIQLKRVRVGGEFGKPPQLIWDLSGLFKHIVS